MIPRRVICGRVTATPRSSIVSSNGTVSPLPVPPLRRELVEHRHHGLRSADLVRLGARRHLGAGRARHRDDRRTPARFRTAGRRRLRSAFRAARCSSRRDRTRRQAGLDVLRGRQLDPPVDRVLRGTAIGTSSPYSLASRCTTTIRPGTSGLRGRIPRWSTSPGGMPAPSTHGKP